MCNISRPPSNCVEFSQNPKFISTMASPEDSVELLMLKMIVVNGWKVKNSSGGKKEATQASGARGLWSKAVYKVEKAIIITTNISIIFINITDKSSSPSQILTKAVHKVGEGLRLRCSTTMQWMESSNKVFSGKWPWRIYGKRKCFREHPKTPKCLPKQSASVPFVL